MQLLLRTASCGIRPQTLADAPAGAQSRLAVAASRPCLADLPGRAQALAMRPDRGTG